MSVKYKDINANKVFYNNQSVNKIFYNGKEIDYGHYFRYQNDKSRVNQTELKFSNSIGEASVNLYSGRLLFKCPLISIGEGNFKINLSLVYNSKWVEKEASIGWRLNFAQVCYPYIFNDEEHEQGFCESDYVYIDELGYKHRFIKYKDVNNSQYYYDKSGTNLVLCVSKNNSIITDELNNKLIFNEKGQLINIESGINHNIKKVIEYHNDQISSIYDQRKSYRKLDFAYDENDFLISITCSEKNQTKKILSFNYQESDLVSISEQVKNNTKTISIFEYLNHLLFLAIDAKNTSTLAFNFLSKENQTYQISSVIYGNSLTFLEDNFISNDNVISRSEFTYSSSHQTIVLDTKKTNSFLYSFNDEGYTSSIFEIDHDEFQTLTKENGVLLSTDGNGDTIINTHRSSKANGNTFNINSTKISDFVNLFSPHENGEKSNYHFDETFALSFYFKNTSAVSNDIIARLTMNTDYGTLTFKAFVDKTANDVWQQVIIPIDFQSADATENTEKYSDHFFVNDQHKIKSSIKEMKITFDGLTETSSFEIVDIRIARSKQSNLFINDKSLSSIKQIGYYFDEEDITLSISQNFFLTEKDVFLTYKNMYLQKLNKENSFDLVYCNGTKRLYVENVFFHTKHSRFNYFSIDENGFPNYYMHCRIRYSENDWCGFKSNIQFTSSSYKQIIKVGTIKNYNQELDENTSSKSEQDLAYVGLSLSSKDAYGIIQMNKFDDYGNLISTTKFNENNGNETMTKQVYYDTNDSALAETIVSTDDNNIKTQTNSISPFFNIDTSTVVGGQYVKKHIYDEFNEKITEIQAIFNDEVIAKNKLNYDERGNLEEVFDKFSHHYKFVYDNYNNISCIKTVDENGSEKEILSKEYTYSTTNQIKETYSSNNSTITRTITYDIYNRLLDISDEDGHIKYVYQSIDESPSVSSVAYIYDSFSKQTYNFLYNEENQPYGYKIIPDDKESHKTLSIRQLTENKTNYIFTNNNEETIRTSECIYEDQEAVDKKIYLNPRLRKTKDGDIERTYYYDDLGRLETKYFFGLLPGIGQLLKCKYQYHKKDSNNTNLVKDITYNSNISLISSITNKVSIIETNLTYNQFLDDRGNIVSIIETQVSTHREEGTTSTTSTTSTKNIIYEYDALNRLTKERNEFLNIDYNHVYNTGKLSKITKNESDYKTFYYDNGILSSVNIDGKTNEFTYDNFGNISKINISNNNENSSISLKWERGNILKKYGQFEYFNNYQGIRFIKKVDDITKFYYLDKDKILGEDWSDGTKIRYFYDANGITAIEYDSKVYHLAIDTLGNVRKIFFNTEIVCSYDYDSFGECQITIHNKDHASIANINPFRWKSFYYDTETNLYYVKGRYYSPEIGIYINADNPDCILEQVYTINSLDRYANNIDNNISADPNDSTIFTSEKYYPDTNYYPNEDKSWWDLYFKEVIRWILFTVLIITAIVLIAIPGTRSIGLSMLKHGISFAISGMIFNGIFNGVIAAIQGNDITNAINEGMINGFIDGFIMGMICGFLSGFASRPTDCFKAGTLVLTKDGHKKIEEIKIGDKVWAYDEKTKTKKLKAVVKLFKNKTKKWIHLFINNEEIICTPSHPFFILNKGWVIANKLVENDIVVLYNDNIVKIQSIYVETLNTEEFTYNFEVEDYHTYYVSCCNVLVHNTCKVTNEEGKVLYRGGNDLLEKIDKDLRKGNIIQPGRGPSLSTDINFAISVSEGRGAYTLDKIPEGLVLKQTGKSCHYVIGVLKPMPREEFIALLKTIKLTPA